MYGGYKREELEGDTRLKPLRIYEEWIEIEKLKKVGVPQQRVYTKRDVEEEEAIKKAIEKDYIGFFEVSPVILCKSNESGNIYLADGWIRMKTAILNNIPKVKVKIKEYETDVEAYKDALVTSYNVNSSRGRVSGYSLLNMVKFLREELKMSVKEIAEELNKSEKHIYNLLAILEHEDLVEKVKNEEISLKEAIKLAYKHEPSLTVRLEGEEGEKPQIEAISEKEAQTGLAKTCKAISEEISQKEAKIKEIGKKETESKVYKHLEIPSSIKSEMEKALEKLEEISLIEEEDKQKLMEKAYNLLKAEDSVVQREAIRLWKKECIEDYTLYDLKNFIDKAREIVEERRMLKELREPLPKPKPKQEPKIEEASREAPRELSEEERVNMIIDYLKKMFRHPFVHRFLVDDVLMMVLKDEEVKEIYKDLGLQGSIILFSKVYRELAGKLSSHPKDAGVIYNVVKEFREKILKTYKSKRDEILSLLGNVKPELLKPLIEFVGEDAEVIQLSNGYTLVLSKNAKLIVSRPADIWRKNPFTNDLVNIQELLACSINNLNDSPAARLLTKQDKYVVERWSAGPLRTEHRLLFKVDTLKCPRHKGVLTCIVCGAPVVCECGWPEVV